MTHPILRTLSDFDWSILNVISTREISTLNVPLLRLTLQLQSRQSDVFNSQGAKEIETVTIELTSEELKDLLMHMLPIQEELRASIKGHNRLSMSIER